MIWILVFEELGVDKLGISESEIFKLGVGELGNHP